MGILYLLFGVLIGSHASRLIQRRNKEEVHTENNSDNEGSNKKGKKFKVRKKIKKLLAVNSDSPEGIDPEKIKIGIKENSPERNKSSPNPSFIPLAVLWAHFVSKQLGLLKEGYPTPWELTFSDKDERTLNTNTGINISIDSWKDFLANIVEDKNWYNWIKCPDEVRKRTLLAFNN